MANEDTLHYLNNRFTVYKNIFKVNDQTKIIKNFKNINNKDNIYKTYYWGNKKINFPGLISLTPLGVNYSVDFTDFFCHQDLFNYKIVEDDSYYKLEFKQKRKIGLFSIEGYLIIDKFDYGIYEFESKLLNDKPFFKKEINFSTSKPLVFKVLMDTYHFKYVKEEGRYILDNSNKSTTFIEEKGDFKQIVFKSIIQVEKTKNFSDRNLKEFDMVKWEYK
ncbi:hypothetical protein ACHMWN_04150 [Pedobacter sp. UC225_61]|uniref:hypothetical protein n=1 Tax=Pedobacter sp. UC225_61 TaxID=3374623 RepID=UPI0037A1AE43